MSVVVSTCVYVNTLFELKNIVLYVIVVINGTTTHATIVGPQIDLVNKTIKFDVTADLLVLAIYVATLMLLLNHFYKIM